MENSLERVKTDTSWSSFEEPARIAKGTLEPLDIRVNRSGSNRLNGKVERFNKTIKSLLKNHLYNGITLKETQIIVDGRVQWYNKIKPHASLKRLTPHQRLYGVQLAKSA